jgi:hypothetical protein
MPALPDDASRRVFALLNRELNPTRRQMAIALHGSARAVDLMHAQGNRDFLLSGNVNGCNAARIAQLDAEIEELSR